MTYRLNKSQIEALKWFEKITGNKNKINLTMLPVIYYIRFPKIDIVTNVQPVHIDILCDIYETLKKSDRILP